MGIWLSYTPYLAALRPRRQALPSCVTPALREGAAGSRRPSLPQAQYLQTVIGWRQCWREGWGTINRLNQYVDSKSQKPINSIYTIMLTAGSFSAELGTVSSAAHTAYKWGQCQDTKVVFVHERRPHHHPSTLMFAAVKYKFSHN